MNTPSDLNETDTEILSLLSEGRETGSSLADQISKHENYIKNALNDCEPMSWCLIIIKGLDYMKLLTRNESGFRSLRLRIVRLD